ncbi:hypothetical protein VOLCADRAFT_102982 [Volvox carteri f. nagariensis]|uniref:U3 small nucleolar RNA-associated protein 6 homolog C-terminal domain-containing protein n=1 Tax=Volvox carteri f. nagariensis TaxID=3068 RepID=D8TJ70_VOLCA|nr:uncharacterized protein VOLCADRAFT_102982 [Volvox carteri f. nagariensis]EFJ52487.1 hypothetical protein VOLCADRAFT_102982 [Volvox carteri f. nagariensis]|eukprot:XP_002946560.1 hypothetical protein VOLCADRAFT_102982 [Volvox carteri f. nagariensis]
MADTVQYLMELMIPELEDLERKGYFSRKKSIAEIAIVRRIHFIYERAGRKFRSDLSLWMRWIEACKRYKSSKQLSKVITKALQRHSTVSELWIEAARWEFDMNNNITAARSLMQQGIRMCKTDETIWVQYYHLELLYALKLRLRRRVLGLDDPSAAEDIDEADGQSVAAARAVMQGGVARIVYKNAVAALPGRLAFRARFLGVLRGFEYGFVEALLDQVYDSIRQDFGKVEEAWDLLARRHIDFPTSRRSNLSEEKEGDAAERQLGQRDGSTWMSDQIQVDAQAPNVEPAWDADGHRQACSVYEEGLTAVPTPRIYRVFSKYLCETLDRLMAQGEAVLQPALTVAAQLFSLLQRAHSSSCSCPETYLTWVDWAERVQQPKMALKAARKGCERFPSNVAMWRRRLELEVVRSGDRKDHAVQEIMAIFEAALQATSPEQTCEVWLMAIDTLPANCPEFARLGEMLAVTCAKVAKKAPSGGLGQVATALVEKARGSLGIDNARHLYAKLLAVPAPGGDLYRCAIRLERDALRLEYSADNMASGSCAPPKQAAKRIADLYEAAIAAYGKTETDLWLDYAVWLTQCGKGSGQVYWRATKELAEPDSFIAQYREALQ